MFLCVVAGCVARWMKSFRFVKPGRMAGVLMLEVFSGTFKIPLMFLLMFLQEDEK